MEGNIAVGSGRQSEGTPYQKGYGAASDALRRAGGHAPAFALIFGSCREGAMEILRGVRDVIGSCPLLGCLAGKPEDALGETAPFSLPHVPDAVQVVILASPCLRAKVGVGRVPKGDWEKGLTEAFKNSYIRGSASARPGVTEKSLCDWYLYRRPSLAMVAMISRPSESRVREQRVVSYLGEKFRGRVPIIMYSYSPEGGLPLVFADKKVVREGIVMAIIKTDVQFSLERFHNFEPIGKKLFITRSEGRKVLEFNRNPALGEYLSSVGEGSKFSLREWKELASRFPLAYRGREGRYHLCLLEDAGEDLSITLPMDPDPDLPLYPMSFIPSHRGEFYRARVENREWMDSQGVEAALIIRNTDILHPPVFVDPGGEAAGGETAKVIEVSSAGRLRAYLPDEYWTGEASHLALLMKKELDPVALAAVENGELLEEVFRLKDLNQKVFDGIGYGIALLDREQRVLHSNNTYRVIMDGPGETFHRQQCHWMTRGVPACPLCVAKSAISGGTFSSIEVQRQEPDGRVRWMRVDAFPLCDAEGNIDSAIEVIRDISEIKELQISLEQERRKIEAVVGGVAESIYIVGRDHELRFFHHGSSSLPLGKIPEGGGGLKCFAALFRRESPCPWCRVAEAFNEGKVTRRMADLPGEGGENRYFQITFSPMRDARNEVTSAACLLVDITAQKMMEQQVIKSEKLSSLAVLSAGMAHELNNPLGAINFNVEVLKKKEHDPAFAEILENIRKDVMRINRIVNNLLSFSRSGGRSHGPLSLPEAIDAALDLSSVIIERNRLAVRRSYDPRVGPVQGNFQELQHVFINLISNAADAMSGGGNLTIRVSPVWMSGGEVSAERESPPTGVEVVFSDTGAGIAKENLDRIFDPFFTTRLETQGTGLGLSVVHKILENHAATISVQSRIGEGTSFIMRFPALPAEENGEKNTAVEGRKERA